jgi:hypothetical protein
MIFTEEKIRSFAAEKVLKSAHTARTLLKEERIAVSDRNSFDVFLSHSIKDAEIILGVKTLLERKGLTVYVDWIIDNNLDRNNVTSETADRLRKRMRQSKSLIYVHSLNSPDSKWMPWELGFFDGYSGAIAVLPISQTENVGTFKGQEFLGLYPYIDTLNENNNLYVNKGSASYEAFGTFPQNTWVQLKDWMTMRAKVYSMK